MTVNIFAIESQNALDEIIHRRSGNSCAGAKFGCESCEQFQKASAHVHELALTRGVITTLTQLENPVLVNRYYQVWCEECCDGANDTFFEAAWWARFRAKDKH